MAGKLGASAAFAGLIGQAGAFVTQLAGSLLRASVASRDIQAGIACAQTQATAASTRLGGAVCSALGGIAIAAVATSVRAGRRKGAYAGRAKVVTLHAAADPTAAAVKVGDAIPNIGLDKGFPPEKVMLADYCKGKKVVLVGLPGAFTPT
jgi:hypothetical protein